MQYDETKEVVGPVFARYIYLVDGVPRRPERTMDAAEWKRQLGCERITFCDVWGRGLHPDATEDDVRSPYENDDDPDLYN
jgi:hypothetical protein